MNKHLLFYCFLLLTINGFSQQNLSLYGLDHLIDQHSVKPTYFGNNRFELSLFPLSVNLFSNGPVYQDFISRTGSAKVLTYPENVLAFGQGNKLRVGGNLETIRFVYTEEDLSLSLNHSFKVNGFIDYSGALAEIAVNGNAPYIGQNISLDTDFSIQAYQEWAFGAAFQVGNVSIGGRFKYLSGEVTAISRKSSINLLTDEDIYQLFLDMDVEIDVAGENTSSTSDIDLGRIGINFSGNHGLALDFGVEWQINEQMSLSLSALDIGEINWKKAPKKYTANKTFEFEGLSLGQLTLDEDEVLDFETIQDSIDIIQFDETKSSFSTKLSPQLYMGFVYEINEKWSLNATGYYTSIHNNNFSAFSLGTNYQVAKFFNIGTAYGIMNEEDFLLGLNTTFQFGPFQLYAMTDNIIGAFKIDENRTFNARFGMGFTFGGADKGTREIPSL